MDLLDRLRHERDAELRRHQIDDRWDLRRFLAEDRAEAGALATGDDAVVETYPFRSDRLVLALPPGHALAGRERVPFAETLASDFIGLAGDTALHQHLVGHATRAGRRMRLRARAQGVDVVCRMVTCGAGVAVVPEVAAQRWQERGELGVVHLEDSWAERGLRLVVRRMDALPSQARPLAAHLLDV